MNWQLEHENRLSARRRRQITYRKISLILAPRVANRNGLEREEMAIVKTFRIFPFLCFVWPEKWKAQGRRSVEIEMWARMRLDSIIIADQWSKVLSRRETFLLKNLFRKIVVFRCLLAVTPNFLRILYLGSLSRTREKPKKGTNSTDERRRREKINKLKSNFRWSVGGGETNGLEQKSRIWSMRDNRLEKDLKLFPFTHTRILMIFIKNQSRGRSPRDMWRRDGSESQWPIEWKMRIISDDFVWLRFWRRRRSFLDRQLSFDSRILNYYQTEPGDETRRCEPPHNMRRTCSEK